MGDGITRRGLLQGASVLGGAALVGVGGLHEIPAAARARFALAATEVGAAAVTPGLTYLSMWFDPFIPPILLESDGRVVANQSVAGSIQDLFASVPIPSGVRIKEVAFVATNSTVSTSGAFELLE